jgi:uncharacterized protein (DUF58 family)
MGWLYLGVSLLVGLAAVRSHMPMMFIFFGAMLGVMAAASWLGRLMLSSITVRRELPSRAWQFESLYFGYHLRNRRWLGCLGTTLSELAPEGIEDARGYCVYLPPRGVFRAGSRLVADHRGRVTLRGVTLTTEFPFGLVRITRRMDDEASLVIWPAKGRITTDFLQRGAMEASAAQAGRHQGGQDEFFGLREYRQGDSPRWIHWRRSAGRTMPVVREMAHPVPDRLMLILDTALGGSDDAARAVLEKPLRFAATLIDHALTRGYQVGLALPGPDGAQVFAPHTSVQSRRAMLDGLADADPADAVDLDALIDEIDPPLLAGAQAWVLTARAHALSAHSHRHVSRLARHMGLLRVDQLDTVFRDHPFGPLQGCEVVVDEEAP